MILRDSGATFRGSARYCNPSKITTSQIRAVLRSSRVRICPKILGWAGPLKQQRVDDPRRVVSSAIEIFHLFLKRSSFFSFVGRNDDCAFPDPVKASTFLLVFVIIGLATERRPHGISR